MKKLLISALLIPFAALAQNPWPTTTCKNGKLDLFKSDSVIEISLKGSFPVDNEPKAAEIKETKANKAVAIKTVSRGKSRGYGCDFKPIRIQWSEDKKNDTKGTIFDDVKGKDMKLVTHCRYTTGTIDQNAEANDVIVKEYTVYKMLKAFGLPVFNVRLAKVQYNDMQNKPQVEGLGFFIESNAQFEDRCDLTHAKREEVLEAVSEKMNMMIHIPYLFSRLITDARDFILAYQGGHNSEPFFQKDSKITQVVVPYDFNDSGQVNSGVAPYWNFTPALDYWFNLLRQGPFTRDAELMELTAAEKAQWKIGVISMAQQLLAKKEAVIKVIESAPLLDASKVQFRKHVDELMMHFQKIVDDHATPVDGLKKPPGIW